MSTDNRDEFVDEYEEHGEIRRVSSPGVRMRNPLSRPISWILQASAPVARVVEGGPWTRATFYVFDASTGHFVRTPHTPGEPYPQIVIPPGAECVLSGDMYRGCHQMLCEAAGCTRGLFCRSTSHRPKKIVGGYAVDLVLVARGDAEVPRVQAALAPQPPAPPPVSALDDLLLAQVQQGGAA